MGWMGQISKSFFFTGKLLFIVNNVLDAFDTSQTWILFFPQIGHAVNSIYSTC
jgi:hypothetical protein